MLSILVFLNLKEIKYEDLKADNLITEGTYIFFQITHFLGMAQLLQTYI